MPRSRHGWMKRLRNGFQNGIDRLTGRKFRDEIKDLDDLRISERRR